MAKFRFRKGNDIFSKVTKLIGDEAEKTLDEVALTATDMIIERTDKGKNRKGQKFKHYAASTIRQKKRKEVRGGGRIVNLQDSGQMMNRINVVRKAKGNKARIGVIGGFEQKKMQYNIKMKRDPLGVTGKERGLLVNLAKKRILRVLKKI